MSSQNAENKFTQIGLATDQKNSDLSGPAFMSGNIDIHGVKGGVHYGATDEIGNEAVENRVSVNDLHATILHLCGLDHKKLTYHLNGRDFRLTDVAGEVVKEIIR